MRNRNRDLIRRFYEELWNSFNKRKIPELLTDNIKFRGSLGEEKFGHSGFAEYLDKIQAAFPDFTNHVEEIISEDDGAFARLTYLGTILGIPPTGYRVEYAGAAVFHFYGEKIAEVWVLGDIHGLLQQLRGLGYV
ncbi:MAG TPA: ester cyclase [Candidatus Limnocylindrales bacterium]|nr:ester cyclase [Candidatus Limnocylindrales bacterium]